MSQTQDPYVTAETVDEVCELLDEFGHDAKLMAGGQSLSLLLRQNLLDPSVIVDISQIPSLDGLTMTDESVTIGATTTYNELKGHEIASEYSCLGDAVAVIADEQIRNQGTIGGAVAHADPSLDVLPPLLCLDATLTLVGPDGERTVSFADFYAGYMVTELDDGELVAGITFDRIEAPHGSAYEKFANVEGGWATVGVGSALTLTEDRSEIDAAHVALSAVGDTPLRAHAAEAVLEGSPPTNETVELAAEEIATDIDPIEDLSGSAEYKASLASRLGKRNIHDAIDRALDGDSR